MTEAEARARLERMTAAGSDPVLSGDELDDLLAMCRLADAAGRAPADPDWAPTWDLNRAAAEGWRWKAGKAAARFDADTDGTRLSRSQITEHCLAMAAQYARRVVTSVPLAGAWRGEEDAKE